MTEAPRLWLRWALPGLTTTTFPRQTFFRLDDKSSTRLHNAFEKLLRRNSLEKDDLPPDPSDFTEARKIHFAYFKKLSKVFFFSSSLDDGAENVFFPTSSLEVILSFFRQKTFFHLVMKRFHLKRTEKHTNSMNASGCVIKIITQKKKCLRLLLLMFEVFWEAKAAFFLFTGTEEIRKSFAIKRGGKLCDKIFKESFCSRSFSTGFTRKWCCGFFFLGDRIPKGLNLNLTLFTRSFVHSP